jgi:hypothetical protein
MSSRARKILIRTVMLFCAIVLLVDLAEDGYLGKADPIMPPCSGKIFHSCSPGKSGSAESPVLIPPERLPDIFQGWRDQSFLVENENLFTIIDCYLLGSSGGLPL